MPFIKKINNYEIMDENARSRIDELERLILDITGYKYEPWHYRYVGEEVARYIMDNDLTLEEYWEELKQNG